MDPMAAEGLTDGMTHLKREKSRNTTDAILNALDKKKYDGQQKQYRRWFKAVVEQLEEVGFYNIERDIKLENLEEIDEETWVQYYSVPDRRYIYTAVKATPPGANDAYENEKKNGILLLHHPAPNLQSPERILTEFFPGTPDNMKIALLMRTVNTDKYRSILDSMKIPGMVIPTYLELKQAVQNHYATDRAEHEQKMKGGKRKAQQEENRTPKPKISPHAALATVAAEVRRPSRKTRQRSLRMKGFLNSSVHSVQQLWANHDRTYHRTCPNPRPGGGRGRGGRGAAGGRGRGYGRGYTRMDRSTSRTLNASNVGAWALRQQAQHRAQFARRITSANRPQAVITCTTISRNLLARALAANGGTSRSADSSSTTTEETRTPSRSSTTSSRRGGTATRLRHDDRHHIPSIPARIRYPCARGTTSAASRLAHFNETKIKASIAAGAKFGEHKTSQTPPPRNSRTSVETDVPTPSYRGDKYFIHFTDDKTRHMPYALRKKSDYANALRNAHSAYVYDPVTDTDIHPRTSPSLRRTRHEFRQHHLGRRQPHRFGTAAPVEGGGGDGLDEVDKFIHDALNQAPPTRVVHRQLRVVANPTSAHWASTVTANGWSTTGYRLNNYDSIFANPPFPSVTELHHIRDCEAVFDANKTLSITLVIPDWESVTLTAGNTSCIPAGEEVYRHPNGKSCGKTRWDVAVYRLCRSSHDGLTLAVIRRNTRLEDIESKMWYGIKYCGTQSLEQNMFRKVELHAWPGWDGLIVGYDTNTQVYEIAVSNGEFDDAKKNEFDVKGAHL
ncbi:hypothetical protein RI054_14g68270 [Pseudoscourfieldia marina]